MVYSRLIELVKHPAPHPRYRKFFFLDMSTWVSDPAEKWRFVVSSFVVMVGFITARIANFMFVFSVKHAILINYGEHIEVFQRRHFVNAQTMVKFQFRQKYIWCDTIIIRLLIQQFRIRIKCGSWKNFLL